MTLIHEPNIADADGFYEDLVNAQRIKSGVAPLHPDALLEQSAQTYAQDMLSRGFFSHVSPTGQTLNDRILQSGYYDPIILHCNCVTRFLVGENLAQGQRTADEVVQDWMQSPTHRSVLLDPAFTDTGVGEAAGIWVEHFGGVQRTDDP